MGGNGRVQKTVHRRGMRIRLLMDEKEALGAPRAASPSVSASPADELERALPELCPRLMEVGFTTSAAPDQRAPRRRRRRPRYPSRTPCGMRITSWNAARSVTAQPVSRPVDWVFRCLSKDGTYRIPTGYVSPAELRRREREEAVRREREALEAERRLLEEEAALALEKEVEAMFRQMLDEPDGPFAAQIMEKVPAVLRSRGGLENPLVQKACRCKSAICSRTPSERGSRAILCVHSARICSMDISADNVPVRDACGCAWTGHPSGRPGQRVRAGCPDMLDTQSVRGVVSGL